GDKMPGESYAFTSKKYKDNEACTLTIKGPTISQRIIVSIGKMDIAPDGNCGDSLKIYDGKVGGTLLNSVATEQCGKKDFYVRSNSNTAVIVFSSNNDGKQGTGFTATVAIDFPVASCAREVGFYRCKNNYCISSKFECSSKNYCGDNSQKLTCSRK
ncbi:unnamed protein product, partial [Didymodactylos carnosus]